MGPFARMMPDRAPSISFLFELITDKNQKHDEAEKNIMNRYQEVIRAMPDISDKNRPLQAQNPKTWKRARQQLSKDANTKGGCTHCEYRQQFESVT